MLQDSQRKKELPAAGCFARRTVRMLSIQEEGIVFQQIAQGKPASKDVRVLVGSVELARLRLRGVQLLTLSSFLPMPLLMVVGGWWVSPMGKSIAAATGVGLGGLLPMMITLLPLWAGLLWSKVFRPTSTPAILH